MKTWPALISGIPPPNRVGHVDPAKVLGFLNVMGEWVPDLIFVMGAVVVTALLTPAVLSRARPLFADGFSVPTAQALDTRLIGGAVLFGIGWAYQATARAPRL